MDPDKVPFDELLAKPRRQLNLERRAAQGTDLRRIGIRAEPIQLGDHAVDQAVPGTDAPIALA